MSGTNPRSYGWQSGFRVKLSKVTSGATNHGALPICDLHQSAWHEKNRKVF
jgi:hypothetical protein